MLPVRYLKLLLPLMEKVVHFPAEHSMAPRVCKNMKLHRNIDFASLEWTIFNKKI